VEVATEYQVESTREANRGWRMIGLALVLAMVVFIASGHRFSHDDELLSGHRWECVACVFDHVVGMPLAWGATSAMRNSLHVVGGVAVGGGGGGSLAFHELVAWAARALADGIFLPVDECLPVLQNRSMASVRDAALCGRGVVYFGLSAVDRFELALIVDELLAAACAVMSETLQDTAPQLTLHALKLASVLSAPDPMIGYFVSNQITLGASLLDNSELKG